MYITGDVIFEIVIFCLFGGIIWGCISGLIGERKGNKWGFWWGFFLGIIGVVVVICISGNKNEEQEQDEIGETTLENCKDNDETVAIEKYKKMLDDGLITEEEFAAKKKQILGI